MNTDRIPKTRERIASRTDDVKTRLFEITNISSSYYIGRGFMGAVKIFTKYKSPSIYYYY